MSRWLSSALQAVVGAVLVAGCGSGTDSLRSSSNDVATTAVPDVVAIDSAPPTVVTTTTVAPATSTSLAPTTSTSTTSTTTTTTTTVVTVTQPPATTPPTTAPPATAPPTTASPTTRPPVVTDPPTTGAPSGDLVPFFYSFTAETIVDCSSASVGQVILTWEVLGADTVDIAIGSVDQIYRLGQPATASLGVPLNCNYTNTFLAIATNPDGTTVESISVAP